MFNWVCVCVYTASSVITSTPMRPRERRLPPPATRSFRNQVGKNTNEWLWLKMIIQSTLLNIHNCWSLVNFPLILLLTFNRLLHNSKVAAFTEREYEGSLSSGTHSCWGVWFKCYSLDICRNVIAMNYFSNYWGEIMSFTSYIYSQLLCFYNVFLSRLQIISHFLLTSFG